jgi:hypothetical protein
LAKAGRINPAIIGGFRCVRDIRGCPRPTSIKTEELGKTFKNPLHRDPERCILAAWASKKSFQSTLVGGEFHGTMFACVLASVLCIVDRQDYVIVRSYSARTTNMFLPVMLLMNRERTQAACAAEKSLCLGTRT